VALLSGYGSNAHLSSVLLFSGPRDSTPIDFRDRKNNTWVRVYLNINKFNIPTIETIEKMLIIFLPTYLIEE